MVSRPTGPPKSLHVDIGNLSDDLLIFALFMSPMKAPDLANDDAIDNVHDFWYLCKFMCEHMCIQCGYKFWRYLIWLFLGGGSKPNYISTLYHFYRTIIGTMKCPIMQLPNVLDCNQDNLFGCYITESNVRWLGRGYA